MLLLRFVVAVVDVAVVDVAAVDVAGINDLFLFCLSTQAAIISL